MHSLKFALLFAVPAFSQTVFSQTLTAADYARAEQFMNYKVNPLVLRGAVRPNWLPEDRFWYRTVSAEGVEFMLVDPVRATRKPAFNHSAVAAALSRSSGKRYDPAHLPFTEMEVAERSVSFDADGRRWKCEINGKACSLAEVQKRPDRNEAVSPDEKRTVFIRDYNLWMRDIASGKETQLTTDGEKDFGYATDNAGWETSDAADCGVVARFQKDRDISAGPARRG